jgi:hypothetical protein
MTKRKTLAVAAVAALVLAHVTCNQAILTAPPGATLFLSINPGFIPAHGGVAVVSALVMEPAGTPVPDGTVVQFFTTLGRIDEQGKTNDGVARVNLTSDARSGIAEVTAISGEASDGPVEVQIGAFLPENVFVTADPPRINLSVSRTTHVFAYVVDANGNPVPNVLVLFRVVGVAQPSPSPAPSPTPPATDFIDSQNPVFTDTNGRAEVIVRTQRAAGTPAVIRVEAVVLGAAQPTGFVDIPVQ